MTRLLLVEDDGLLVAQLRRELETEHYSVTSASDADGALSQFRRAPPDLVILDWGLRGERDGIDVLRRIRETSAAPVLMLTARGGIEDKLLGLRVGADDYLVKPFERRELLARLKALLRRAGAATSRPTRERAEVLKVGELELDPESRRVTIGKASVELTKSEFELLALLLSHPDRVFHRGYLLERLRGEDYAGTERSIDSAIVRLRRKLGKFGSRIETVFGVGYRFAKGDR